MARVALEVVDSSWWKQQLRVKVRAAEKLPSHRMRRIAAAVIRLRVVCVTTCCNNRIHEFLFFSLLLHSSRAADLGSSCLDNVVGRQIAICIANSKALQAQSLLRLFVGDRMSDRIVNIETMEFVSPILLCCERPPEVTFYFSDGPVVPMDFSETCITLFRRPLVWTVRRCEP